MSTAVLISGQARTYGHCFANQLWNVYRKLDDPYFFVSVANDENAAAMDQIRNKFGNQRFFIEHREQPDFPENAAYELAQRHSGWKPSVSTNSILRQAWHLARVWDFFKQAPFDKGKQPLFTHFLRIRPDLHFHNCELPQFPIPGAVYTPFWGSWGGIPDRFAFITGEATAQQYFNYYHKIGEFLAEGCPFHPETMLAYALERAGVGVLQTINCEFTTIRTKEELAQGRQHDKAVYTTQDILRHAQMITREAGGR